MKNSTGGNNIRRETYEQPSHKHSAQIIQTSEPQKLRCESPQQRETITQHLLFIYIVKGKALSHTRS